MAFDPTQIQELLNELHASRASRKRAWENLQEIRWVLKDVAQIEAPAPTRKSLDLEGRAVKDAVRKALHERQDALVRLVNAVKEYKRLATYPESIRGSEYAQAIVALGKAIDLAENLIQD
jgi:hypothetical protein